MSKTIRILGANITFVFRHKWDAEKSPSFYSYMFRTYNLGIWFKKFKAVGKKDFKRTTEWPNNLVPVYMVGVDLIVIKMWITLDFGAMEIGI